jgi:hypothetical protein
LGWRQCCTGESKGRNLLQKCYGRAVARSPNQSEFDSLGVEAVAVRASTGMWDEAKSRDAREWVSRENSRIERSAWAAAMRQLWRL